MNRPLRIALTKGRLEKDTVGLLEKIGYDCTAIREKGRKLILPVPDGNLEVVLAKHLPQRKAQSSTADLMSRQLQQNTLTSQEDFLKQREWTLTSSR